MAWRLLSPFLPNQLLSAGAGDTRQKRHLLPSTNTSLHCPCHNKKHLPCRTSADARYSLRASSSSSSSSSSPRPSFPKTRLYVSGLSFRTTEESLRNAFENYGNLVEVKLVMDKIANRPRGFAFLRYSTEEESQKAIQGMHGKFLDGRVIFVEVAKPRPDNRQSIKQSTPRF